MRAQDACYECFKTQIQKTHKLLGSLGANLSSDELFGLDLYFDNSKSPPEIASNIYREVREKSGIADIYKDLKKESIEMALKLKPLLKERMLKTQDRLDYALKVAVLGNVIDYGIASSFNIPAEIQKLDELTFEIDHASLFKAQIQSAKSLLYLADNAGENIFDELLVEALKEAYPHLKIYYVPRGRPIINDITYDELDGLEIHKLAVVINSGIASPGFVLKEASKEARELFLSADVILSKGMGNFETLSELSDKRVFCLFKIKCEVVANYLNKPLGSYIFKSLGCVE